LTVESGGICVCVFTRLLPSLLKILITLFKQADMQRDMKKFRYILFYAMIALGLARNVAAATTDWQDLGGGRARVIAVIDPANGVIEGVVEVDLQEGWKTYWRSPGASGIPPEFDFSGSTQIEIDTIGFPPPEEIQIPSSSFVGYHDRVGFVFSGTWSGPGPSLKIKLLIGVCEEICIPAMADFEISAADLNHADPRGMVAIELAKDALPKPVSAAGGPSMDFALQGHALRIEIASEFNVENLLLEGPASWYIPVPKRVKAPVDRTVFATEFGTDIETEAIRSADLLYTVVTDNGAFEGKVDLR
jgi:DsbC/DsbD-like thiol-disulfide interchange protein